MDISRILTPVFSVAIIAIIYLVIFFSLRIMYKDVKYGDKKKRSLKKKYGLEVLTPGENSALKKGSLIPINNEITLGRKEDNLLVLTDPYVSGHHTRIFIRNTDYFVEDLSSTNGTFLNGERIIGKEYLNPGDEVKIGSALFRVID